MHIILLTTSYPESGNGQEAAGSFVADFAEELSKHHRVTVIAPGLAPATASQGKLHIERFAVPSLPLSLLKPYNPLHWLRIWTSLKNGGNALDQTLHRDPADYVFALWALPSGYWAGLAKKRHGTPYGVWALGSDIWALGKIPLVKNILAKVLRNASHRYADGQLLATQVAELCGRPCEFLPSSRRLALTMDKPLATEPPYRLSYLGRWHPNKGIDILLDSLELLDDADWQRIAGITIAGGGPMQGLVQQRCQVLAAAGRPVRLLSYLDKTAAATLLGNTDYLLLPSRIESIPVIFSDAMQCLCPIASTPVGDLPQLMRQFAVGELAQAATPTAFAAALQQLLQIPPAQFRDQLMTARSAFSLEHSVSSLLTRISAEPAS